MSIVHIYRAAVIASYFVSLDFLIEISPFIDILELLRKMQSKNPLNHSEKRFRIHLKIAG